MYARYEIIAQGQVIGHEYARNEIEACDLYAEGSTYRRQDMTARMTSGSAKIADALFA